MLHYIILCYITQEFLKIKYLFNFIASFGLLRNQCLAELNTGSCWGRLEVQGDSILIEYIMKKSR